MADDKKGARSYKGEVIGDSMSLTINFKWLLQIIAGTAVVVYFFWRMESRILDLELTEKEAEHLLTNRVSQKHLHLLDNLDWYSDMPPEVQGVILEMVYQLGFSGFKKFKKAISNMKSKDWKGAATEMLDSRWAKQTPNRANQLADIVREHG